MIRCTVQVVYGRDDQRLDKPVSLFSFTCLRVRYGGGELHCYFHTTKEARETSLLFRNRRIEAFHFDDERHFAACSIHPHEIVVTPIRSGRGGKSPAQTAPPAPPQPKPR